MSEKLKCKDVKDVKFTDATGKILKRLKCGNKRFMKSKLKNKKQDSVERKKWLEKQEPFAIVLSCADSRVVPELVFDTGLGELFTIRVAGNIANTSSIASIEYAVAVLKCKFILVLGHEKCGAVGAAMSGNDFGDNLSNLVGHILPAVNACNCESSENKASTLEQVVVENALHSASELVRCSAIIRDAVNLKDENKKVKIHTGYYNLESGKVDFDRKSIC